MRRDVYIQNDSGGFSVVAGDAVDAIVQDGRADDLRFVSAYKALLVELYGDDSMPVRIVVDEPLTEDEQAEWLARASWRIDTADGRLVVMGGFDPDVLQDWSDETGGAADAAGVALVTTEPGSLRVDVYAHVGSMNGRQILSEAGSKPGAAFRRSHPAQPFPLWLAKMLEFSGEKDPGHEEAWRDVRASIDAGTLSVDLPGANVIGFLVHVTHGAGAMGDPPEGGWFERRTNSRVPERFPLGLATDAMDPDLDGLRDRLLGRSAPEVEGSPVTGLIEIIEAWTGDPLRRVEGHPAITLAPADAYFLYWIAGLTADSPPRFELWVTATSGWASPAATVNYAVMSKGPSVTALGPSPDAAGWLLWHAARFAAGTLAGLPEGATIDLAMAPRHHADDEGKPAVGRAIYSGTVKGGRWEITEASPAIARDTLDDAVSFVRDLVAKRRISVRTGAERDALERAAQIYSPEEGSLAWDGDGVTVMDPDERTLLMLASPVFRIRFAEQWAVDAEDAW